MVGMFAVLTSAFLAANDNNIAHSAHTNTHTQTHTHAQTYRQHAHAMQHQRLRMNDPTTASEKAKSYYDNNTPITPDECDHYCAVWYGLSHSGFSSAAEHWAKTPASYKLSGYEEGALAFWTGGSSGAGHCTIGSPKADTIFSTDYPKKGFVGHTTVGDINSHWTDLKFAGWARAYFPNGVTNDGILLNRTQERYPISYNATKVHSDEGSCPCDNCVKYAECRAGLGQMGWVSCEDKRKASNSPTAHAGCIIFRTGDPKYCHAMYCTGATSSTYSFDQANWNPGKCDSGSISATSPDIIGIYCP